MSELSLRAENLSVTLSGQPLLHDISCRFQKERLTMVMGHNGAGKSLFLKALHGLVPLSNGRIEGPPKSESKLVFQKPILLRRSTEDVFAFIAPDVNSEERQAWLASAGLSDHLDHPARLLSGGQAQKLMLVSMLATKPRILFLDEPTANLDYESTDFVETTLREARDNGLTIIMSSHNRTQVKRLADHILFLDGGRLVDDQPASEFFTSPQHDAAQKWLDFA